MRTLGGYYTQNTQLIVATVNFAFEPNINNNNNKKRRLVFSGLRSFLFIFEYYMRAHSSLSERTKPSKILCIYLFRLERADRADVCVRVSECRLIKADARLIIPIN